MTTGENLNLRTWEPPSFDNLDDVRFAKMLLASDAGQFLRLTPIRRLIAQEAAIEEIRPFVETPDLLLNEPGMIEQWRLERPDFSTFAEKLARKSLISYDLNGQRDAESTDRLLLRLAAYRRLDAWHTGQERHNDRPHAFAGELYLTVNLPDSGRPIYIGSPSYAIYETDPRKDKELFEIIHNELIVTELEYAIYPLAGRGGLSHAPHWRDVRRRWREVAPLRYLESNSRRGAFPSGLFFDQAPDDIKPRIDLAFIDKISPDIFATFGLNPWWPKVTADYFAEREMLYPCIADEGMLESWCRRLALRRQKDH